MSKECSLKEGFIETQLEKFQPDWKEGKDITKETKKQIRDYAASKMPDEVRDTVCVTDYTISHMAKLIRERNHYAKPNKSNKGNTNSRNKDGGRTPSEEKKKVIVAVRKLTSKFSIEQLKEAIATIESENVQAAKDGDSKSQDEQTQDQASGEI